MTRRLRVAFFGSPAFAVPVFERVLREHDVRLAVTQPDAPAGRGLRMRRPPVARAADEAGVPVTQPTRLRRDQAFHQQLREAELDVAITTAYGRILPEAVLALPRHGFLNAHASLLPHLRGAAPIQWALIRGHARTGITVMQTEAGMDTGPIRHVLATDVGQDETAPELFERLAPLAAEAISQALAMLVDGALPSRPQDHTQATKAPLLIKEDGHVRWGDPARAVYDRWRGVLAWPGSTFGHDGRRVRIDGMRPGTEPASGPPGRIVRVAPGALAVACGDGAVVLTRLTPPGRPPMAADDWAHGARLKENDRVA
ncbi:MAG: methionyl-tRNA formyltransferase [Trueperaceae bacterium]